LGAEVFGVSTQDTVYQLEAAERLHLPFELLSDVCRELVNALTLPTFEVGGMPLVKWLTLIVKRGGRIVCCFYPVFPPDADAERVINYLRENAV
jgi:peroxiredoxin